MGDNGRMLVGERGFILGNSIYPNSLRQEAGSIARSIPRVDGHYRDWVESCKSGKPSGSNFDWAGPLAEAVLLGNVALRVQVRELLTRKKLEWDPVGLKITNLREADEFLRCSYRQGWSLG
jgi:hypothetical protein